MRLYKCPSEKWQWNRHRFQCHFSLGWTKLKAWFCYSSHQTYWHRHDIYYEATYTTKRHILQMRLRQTKNNARRHDYARNSHVVFALLRHTRWYSSTLTYQVMHDEFQRDAFLALHAVRENGWCTCMYMEFWMYQRDLLKSCCKRSYQCFIILLRTCMTYINNYNGKQGTRLSNVRNQNCKIFYLRTRVHININTYILSARKFSKRN